jgi:hypothetical protein
MMHGVPRAVIDPDRLRGEIVQEAPVVRDDHPYSAKAEQGTDQNRPGRSIEVVGGLIEQQDIRLGGQRRPYLPSFALTRRES